MIQVLHRALNILEFVANEPDREYSLSEIANFAKINNSTCANIIKTLLGRKYLEQAKKGQGYKLGPQAYILTGNYSIKKRLLNAAIEPMQELRDNLNESCIVAIMKNNMRVTLHKEINQHEVQVVINNNEEKNVYLTATGRVILACMNHEKQSKFIQKYGLPGDIWPEIKDESDLKRELKNIRYKQQTTHNDGNYVVGIASPIYLKGEVIAALGVYLPEYRFTDNLKEKICKEIDKSAVQISERISNLV